MFYIISNIKKMTALYLAVIFFISLDRFLKVLAFSGRTGEFNLLGEILKFSYKKNYYIAFSLPVYGFWLNAAICFIILSLIYYLARAWQGGQRKTAVCLLAVIMGASSNLFDRLKYGFVIDYFDLKYFTIFNLADAAVVSGVFLLLMASNKKQAG